MGVLASGATVRLATSVLPSPVGELRLAATEAGLVKIGFPCGPRSDFHAWLARHLPGAERVETLDILTEAESQLGDYFGGQLRDFELPLDLRGTAFQVEVWGLLGTIPYGETWTYGVLAEALGRPGATRAVGSASGANPLPLVLPCHRVVAAGGRLGGFGGGLDLKRQLLAFEQRRSPALRWA